MAENTKEETQTKAQAETQAKAQTEAQAEAEQIIVTLNPALELENYTFSDGKTFRQGVRYRVEKGKFEEYSTGKEGGRQIVVKD